MGICGVSTYSRKGRLKKDKIQINQNKTEIIISVIYNDEPKKDYTLDKNEKLLSLINLIGLNAEKDYDFYDTNNNTLLNDKLNEELIKIFDISKPILITIKLSCLKLALDNRKYVSSNTYLIGTLLFNNNNSSLGILIYNTKSKQIFSNEYNLEKYPLLKEINHFSSFCNSNNCLYISGGENEENNNNQGTDLFIKIKLDEIKSNELKYSNLINLKYKRYWHSMIFIPEKYIFIIGGVGIKETEVYDIEENLLISTESLNYERCEPSLILVNNKYLYCICGFQFNNNFLNTIEKCNLYKKERKWELVNYQIKSGENTVIEPNLLVSFFGVSYINNDIILIGDKENDKIINPNYLLKPNDNDIDIIEEYGYIEGEGVRLFSEKFFIPINDNESLALPFKKGDAKILILDNNNGNIKQILLNEISEENDFSKSRSSYNN